MEIFRAPHSEESWFFMRFTRRGRYEPTITSRKIAAYKTKQRRYREKFPLFSADITAEQQLGPSVEDAMNLRLEAARQWEADWRRREYLWWRRARAILARLPLPLQAQIRAEWKNASAPGTPTYLLGYIRRASTAAGINIDLLTPPEFAPEVVDLIGKAA